MLFASCQVVLCLLLPSIRYATILHFSLVTYTDISNSQQDFDTAPSITSQGYPQGAGGKYDDEAEGPSLSAVRTSMRCDNIAITVDLSLRWVHVDSCRHCHYCFANTVDQTSMGAISLCRFVSC